MDPDTAKIDNAVLGLLYLTLHDGARAWKSMDWSAMARLHERGLIHDPASKARSVVLTELGLSEAERLFTEQFTKPDHAAAVVRYGDKHAVARSAAGVSGVICRDAFHGQPFFRVYDEAGEFIDYELRHDDLSVTISPEAMASFYRVGERDVLDHSPQVLGLESLAASDEDDS